MRALLHQKSIDSTALLMEAKKIAKIAERMADSLIEFFQSNQFTYKCYGAVLSSTLFAKSLKTHNWNQPIQHIFHGLDISEADANRLIRSEISTIDKLLQTNPREIEEVSSSIVFFLMYWKIWLICVFVDTPQGNSIR